MKNLKSLYKTSLTFPDYSEAFLMTIFSKLIVSYMVLINGKSLLSIFHLFWAVIGDT